MTRDSRSVAKRVRLAPAHSRIKRFSAAEQAQWELKTQRHTPSRSRWVEKTLLAERNER